MDASRGAVGAGERKADTSERHRKGEQQKAAVRWEALILELEKPVLGEPNSQAHGALIRKARCGACPRRARLGIRSLGTIFFWTLAQLSPARGDWVHTAGGASAIRPGITSMAAGPACWPESAVDWSTASAR